MSGIETGEGLRKIKFNRRKWMRAKNIFVSSALSLVLVVAFQNCAGDLGANSPAGTSTKAGSTSSASSATGSPVSTPGANSDFDSGSGSLSGSSENGSSGSSSGSNGSSGILSGLNSQECATQGGLFMNGVCGDASVANACKANGGIFSTSFAKCLSKSNYDGAAGIDPTLEYELPNMGVLFGHPNAIDATIRIINGAVYLVRYPTIKTIADLRARFGPALQYLPSVPNAPSFAKTDDQLLKNFLIRNQIKISDKVYNSHFDYSVLLPGLAIKNDSISYSFIDGNIGTLEMLLINPTTREVTFSFRSGRQTNVYQLNSGVLVPRK